MLVVDLYKLLEASLSSIPYNKSSAKRLHRRKGAWLGVVLKHLHQVARTCSADGIGVLHVSLACGAVRRISTRRLHHIRVTKTTELTGIFRLVPDVLSAVSIGSLNLDRKTSLVGDDLLEVMHVGDTRCLL